MKNLILILDNSRLNTFSMDNKAQLLNVISLIKDNKLNEAELQLSNIYENLAKSKLCMFTVLGKCLMAFIKGEQHNTLEKHNILDYICIQYQNAAVVHLDQACTTFDNDPVCCLLMVSLLIRKQKFAQALPIINDIVTSNKLSDKMHIYAMLLQADVTIMVAPRNKLCDIIKMYLVVGAKAFCAQYKRIEFVALVRVSYLVGVVLNNSHEICEKALVKALEYFTSTKDVVFASIANMNLGNLYLHMKKYTAAEKYLNGAITQSCASNTLSTTKFVQLCLYQLACTYHAQHKYSMAYMMFADIIQQNILTKTMIENCKNKMAECHPNKRIKLE